MSCFLWLAANVFLHSTYTCFPALYIVFLLSETITAAACCMCPWVGSFSAPSDLRLPMETCQHSTSPKWETPFLSWKHLQLPPELSRNWLHWCIRLKGSSTSLVDQQLNFVIYICHFLTHENKVKIIKWPILRKLILTHDSKCQPSLWPSLQLSHQQKEFRSSFHFPSHHCLQGEWKRLILGHAVHGF